MKFQINAIGKLKSSALKSLIDIYDKRLIRGCHIEEYDLKKKLSGEALKKAEADLLFQKIPENAYIIALDEHGKELSSPNFAKLLTSQANHGYSTFVFLIGGAEGHSDQVRKKAHLLLSLGKMTWPHMMVRVMLMEQLYRAQQINAGHPYHKE